MVPGCSFNPGLSGFSHSGGLGAPGLSTPLTMHLLLSLREGISPDTMPGIAAAMFVCWTPVKFSVSSEWSRLRSIKRVKSMIPSRLSQVPDSSFLSNNCSGPSSSTLVFSDTHGFFL